MDALLGFAVLTGPLWLMLILLPVAIWIAILVAKRFKHGGIRLVVGLLVFLPIFFAPFGDELVGRAYLYSLCSANGGYQHKELVKADGYFDAAEKEGCSGACLGALTMMGFTHYESNVRYDYPNHASDWGFYKFYLVNRDSGLCAGGREIPLEKVVLPVDKCVASLTLPAPSSRYEMFMMERSYVRNSLLGVMLEKNFSYLKDRNTNEIIASATSYRYWGGWVRHNLVPNNSATTCPSFNESHGAMQNIFTSNAR